MWCDGGQKDDWPTSRCSSFFFLFLFFSFFFFSKISHVLIVFVNLSLFRYVYGRTAIVYCTVSKIGCVCGGEGSLETNMWRFWQKTETLLLFFFSSWSLLQNIRPCTCVACSASFRELVSRRQSLVFMLFAQMYSESVGRRSRTAWTFCFL